MLLDCLKRTANFVPYVNTGTLFDIMTGRFRQGVNDVHPRTDGCAE